MEKTVKHQAIVRDWIKPEDLNHPETLVLGSFNPFKQDGTKNVDYYYGRSSNYFWKSIASIIRKESDYFFDPLSGFERKVEVMNGRFCCLDVINEISLESENESVVDDYIENNIFSNFLDPKIWAIKPKMKNGEKLQIKRTYNQKVIDVLRNGNIRRVIHTMGNSRITARRGAPAESNLGENGFQGYLNEIYSVCGERNIEISEQSVSPSAIAVRRGFTSEEQLKNWLSTNINFNSTAR